jgi:hypothetical protein
MPTLTRSFTLTATDVRGATRPPLMPSTIVARWVGYYVDGGGNTASNVDRYAQLILR